MIDFIQSLADSFAIAMVAQVMPLICLTLATGFLISGIVLWRSGSMVPRMGQRRWGNVFLTLRDFGIVLIVFMARSFAARADSLLQSLGPEIVVPVLSDAPAVAAMLPDALGVLCELLILAIAWRRVRSLGRELRRLDRE